MNAALADIVGRLKTSGTISPDDVLAMRREVYGAPQVAGEYVEALLALDGALAAGSPEWTSFIGDALVDYVVHQEDPEDYVDDVKAGWLIGACAGPLRRDGAIQALVRVIEDAAAVPQSLESFVLGKAKAAVIAAGQVSADDVALLRRLVFAGGGEDSVGVSREEADMLFDIDDALGKAANDPAWPDFFALAVADSLVEVSPFHVEGRADAARDEAWLSSRPGLLDFFKHMPHAPDVKGVLRDVFDPYADARAEWRDPDSRMEADEAAAAPVTDDEARWLLGRLGGGGALSLAGAKLVARLKADEGRMSPLLKPLLDGAPPPAVLAETGAVGGFGHRKAAPAGS
jgi:hypothetical protein